VDLQTKVIRGEAVWSAARALKAKGYRPDVIFTHPGWGESLFLNDVWPEASIGLYCEFFYHASGADANFDREFSIAASDSGPRLRLKNANFQLQMTIAKRGISPTVWQRSLHPEPFRANIDVIHDGIRTDLIKPNENVSLQISTKKGRISINRTDEILTFVNRNLEPYRGFHVFMRMLSSLMRLRSKLRVIVVGGDELSYGNAPPSVEGRVLTWRQYMLRELGDRLPLDRIHFVGRIPYEQFVTLLQLSSVHVYLTYPFVLSWSMLEAMSAACAVVGSRTPPVEEVITHGKDGYLVDFFDLAELCETTHELLMRKDLRIELGRAARKKIIDTYDLESICLPQQITWVEQLER